MVHEKTIKDEKDDNGNNDDRCGQILSYQLVSVQNGTIVVFHLIILLNYFVFS